MAGEKIFRRTKPFREQFPETAATDLRARTIKTEYGPFGMFHRRFADGRLNLHPIAHGGDLAKWNADLRHPKRAGIHAQKNHAFPAGTKPAQIIFVRLPSVSERIVNVRDGRRELQPL